MNKQHVYMYEFGCKSQVIKYTALVSLKVNVKNDFRAKNCRRLD